MMGDQELMRPGGEETPQLMVHCPRCGQYKPAHHIDSTSALTVRMPRIRV